MTYTAGAEPVAHALFNFAVPDMLMKRDGQGNYPTDFFRCTCWNRLAEVVEKHCSKGTKLLIVGRLKNNNYEKDGQKVYSNEISLNHWNSLKQGHPGRRNPSQKRQIQQKEQQIRSLRQKWKRRQGLRISCCFSGKGSQQPGRQTALLSVFLPTGI